MPAAAPALDHLVAQNADLSERVACALAAGDEIGEIGSLGRDYLLEGFNQEDTRLPDSELLSWIHDLRLDSGRIAKVLPQPVRDRLEAVSVNAAPHREHLASLIPQAATNPAAEVEMEKILIEIQEKADCGPEMASIVAKADPANVEVAIGRGIGQRLSAVQEIAAGKTVSKDIGGAAKPRL